jgi:hypothetical protein
MHCCDTAPCDERRTKQRVFRMWEQIRAVWQASSVFIVGLAVIFGAIYLGGRLSSSMNPLPAAAPTSDQAASSDQGRKWGQPAVASTATPSPQGGSAKQPAQQLAQSGKAPAKPPADQNNPAPTPKPSANAVAPSPAAAASPSAHDHMAANTLSPKRSAITARRPVTTRS